MPVRWHSKGVLWVEVSDSNWLYHLTTLQEKIKNDFNNVVGVEVIRNQINQCRKFCSRRKLQADIDNELKKILKRQKNDNKLSFRQKK